jgi:hypothetical protein
LIILNCGRVIFYIQDHISESSEAIFLVKILKFFDADPVPGTLLTLNPGSGMEKIQIRDLGWKKFRSGIRDKHSWIRNTARITAQDDWLDALFESVLGIRDILMRIRTSD